jgi:hypothetical protein
MSSQAIGTDFPNNWAVYGYGNDSDKVGHFSVSNSLCVASGYFSAGQRVIERNPGRNVMHGEQILVDTVHGDSMENLAELEECPASETYLPSCLVEEDTRIGWCHCCKRRVPVYQEDGHWIYARHPFRVAPRPYMEVLPPE